MDSSILLALLGGFAGGVICGFILEDAYQLVKGAMSDLHNERRRPISRVTMFWIIILFSMAQVAVGVFVIYSNERDKDFRDCVFRYEQQFAQAYRAISGASIQVTEGRFQWEKIVPKFFKEDQPNQADVDQFREDYLAYVDQYRDLQKERRQNPYPPLPSEFCGQPT